MDALIRDKDLVFQVKLRRRGPSFFFFEGGESSGMELTLIGQIGVLSGQAEAREKGDCKKREFFEVVVSAKKLLVQFYTKKKSSTGFNSRKPEISSFLTQEGPVASLVYFNQ